MEKFKQIMRRLYRMRVKVSRGETPVMNVSVLFFALCIPFAFPMVIIGSVAAMLLGYQFSFDPFGEEFATDEIEESISHAAQNIKSAVAGAAQGVRDGIEKARGEQPKAGKSAPAEPKPVRTAPVVRTDPVRETAVSVPASSGTDTNREVLEDLERHADEFQSNPAATSFHSAYSAMAGSVPTIEFPPAADGDGAASGRKAGSNG